jgi:hypothetical protein
MLRPISPLSQMRFARRVLGWLVDTPPLEQVA